MIDVKQAVEIARDNAKYLLGTQSLSLEEIERVDFQGVDAWSITLGFRNNSVFDVSQGPLQQLTGKIPLPHGYKRFLIDARTGEFLAMKLREPVLS